MSSASSNASWPAPRVAWYGVAVLLVAYTFAFIDRAILTLLVEPIQRDLGVNETGIAVLHGFAFAIFYTTLGLPIGWLADRKSRKWIIVAGITVWSLMTAICGLAKNFWQLFLARVGVGVGEAALSPAAYSIISDMFPAEKRSRALGAYTMGVYFGAGLAIIIGGAVVELVSNMPPISLPLIGEMNVWQITFIVVGLPGLIVALLCMTITEPVRRETSKNGEAPTLRETLEFVVARKGAFLGHFVGFGLMSIPFNVVLLWARPFLSRVYGLTPTEAAYGLGVTILVFASAGLYFGGWLADRWLAQGKRDAMHRTAMVAAVCSLPFLAILPFMPSATLAYLVLAPVVFFAGMPWGPAAAAVQMITPNQMRAIMSGLYLFVLNLFGIAVGPVIAGAMTDYVFVDPAAVGYSLAMTAGGAAIISVFVLNWGRAPFRESAETFAQSQRL